MNSHEGRAMQDEVVLNSLPFSSVSGRPKTPRRRWRFAELLMLLLLAGSRAFGHGMLPLEAWQPVGSEKPQPVIPHAQILGLTGTQGNQEAILVTQPKHLELLQAHFRKISLSVPAADVVRRSIEVRFAGSAPRSISIYPDTNTWGEGGQTYAMTPKGMRAFLDLVEELWIQRFCAESDPGHLTVVVHDLKTIRAAPR